MATIVTERSGTTVAEAAGELAGSDSPGVWPSRPITIAINMITTNAAAGQSQLREREVLPKPACKLSLRRAEAVGRWFAGNSSSHELCGHDCRSAAYTLTFATMRAWSRPSPG